MCGRGGVVVRRGVRVRSDDVCACVCDVWCRCSSVEERLTRKVAEKSAGRGFKSHQRLYFFN